MRAARRRVRRTYGSDERRRLSATLVLSLLVHGMLMLGVGFALDDAAPVVPTLDVILTQTQTALTPKQADFLAAGQPTRAAASTTRPTARATAQAGSVPQPEAGVAPRRCARSRPTPAPPPQPARRQQHPRQRRHRPPRSHARADRGPLPRGDEKIERDAGMARLAAEIHLRSERYAKRPKRKFVSASTQEYAWANYLRGWVDRVERVPDQPELPRGDLKISRDAEMARLAAEIHLRSELYAKRPKRKFVSASTKEYAYANYLRAWVDRAERVGNLNYPDEARRKRLSGQLVISVAVRRDGSVEGSRIIQSSGIPLLDSTALRIVQLSVPFPPLPKTDENIDILHVTRTWQFLPGGEVRDDE